jgi:glycosyltransferase involved in cell wall biosynthesis
MHLLRHPVRYRLIHISNMPDFLVLAAWLPRLLGRPVIHDVHDLMPEIYMEKFGSTGGHWLVRLLEKQERCAGKFASVVLTVEERLADILAARGIRRNKIHVLMNLPDDGLFAPRSSATVARPDVPFVLVYHGTLARRLGLDIAIHAVAKLKGTIPGLELRIIGAGEERTDLIAVSEQLGVSDVVTFSDGFVPVEHIPDMIADAAVGLVPLRRCSGTDIMLPTKLLEYVGMGIPCVVPRTGTIARYFDEGMVQFFEAESIDSLADAVLALYHDPARRVQLAREATERFAKRYRWSEHKKIYLDLVDRLLENDVPAARASARETCEQEMRE